MDEHSERPIQESSDVHNLGEWNTVETIFTEPLAAALPEHHRLSCLPEVPLSSPGMRDPSSTIAS
jgi:hypothetical protein